MDAFFVSCELKERPDLRGLPVAVGPDPKLGPTRGVVLSASYEARAFGLRSAMPVSRAHQLCPQAVWLPPDFSKYERNSAALAALLEKLAIGRVDMHSIDEASLRVEAGSRAGVEALAARVQGEIRRELGLPCSIGASPSRTVAKIASDQAKPGGIRVVTPEEVAGFLAPLPVQAIPGVGPKTTALLHSLGAETVGEIPSIPRVRLYARLGGFGDALRGLALGSPSEEAEEERAGGPRSRSVDRTLDHDLAGLEELLEEVDGMAGELADSLRREGWRFRSVTIRLRWRDFETGQRGRSLPAAAEGPEALQPMARRLARELWEKEQRGERRPVRTVAVVAGRLSPRSGRQQPIEAFAG